MICTHRISPVAGFHASWSLFPPSGTCYFAPNICSSLPSWPSIPPRVRRCGCRGRALAAGAQRTSEPLDEAPVHEHELRARPGGLLVAGHRLVLSERELGRFAVAPYSTF